MNAHLTDRLYRARISNDDDYGSRPAIPISAMNNSIYDYVQAAKTTISSGKWFDKPEIPSPAEMLQAPSGATIIDVAEELRPNKVEGAYVDKEEYLSTQYALLREDAIRPLREAVDQVRASPWLNETEYKCTSIGVYDPVYLTSIVFSPRGLATRVAFSLGRVKKHVRWKQSKRLITGTLVALTPADDCFQSICVLATVAARPVSALDQNPPQLDLFIARPDDAQNDPMRKWIMVENRASFYEASRHTMQALQHMKREPFPLSEHLVGGKKDVEPPAYVQFKPLINLGPIVVMEEADRFEHVNILHDWPPTSSQALDASQSDALKRILTKQLAIVQGPPGTGKTHVSVEALKVLLANMTKDQPPIIVTCQTNHALDQLLLHVAEFMPDFIRLGGRSKDQDVIKSRTLYEVRKSTSQPKTNGTRKGKAHAILKSLTNEMQMLLAPLEINQPPLDHRVLAELDLITQEQAESLEMDELRAMGINSTDTPGILMEQWLGKSLMPCHRPIEPDDFGMVYEEEDFEMEQLQELEAEAVARDDDDDIEALTGKVVSLCDNYIGLGMVRTDDDIQALLHRTNDLNTIPPQERGAIYNYFKKHMKLRLLTQFRQCAKRYAEAVDLRKVGSWEFDEKLLRRQRLIGMTTTGLSKYRALVAALSPRIVLVEEAAETLEAPVTAACVPTLEHLILVGDHQQLRPHCQVREFEDEPYHFNLSLFERMVANDVEMACLTRQRRMIPEIRRLLIPIYGDTLKDHDSVKSESNRPPVEGMGGCNSFFFTHEWKETRDPNFSCVNEHEADMVVGHFNHLYLNGIEPSKITVLTFYNGQRKVLLKKFRQHQNFSRQLVNVVTVDSYQGEENDVVLLSLVRSNKRGNIGFLDVDNRVCVALSRAKRGLYIFGNAEMLAIENATWADVVETMYGKASSKAKTGPKRRVGYHMPIQCVNHGQKLRIETPEDWDYINGGCLRDCECVLACGHRCLMRCHPFDNDIITCKQKCTKRVDGCGHPCTAMCMDPCKCQLCERKGDNRSMLKHNPTVKRVVPHPVPADLLDMEPRQQQKAAPATLFEIEPHQSQTPLPPSMDMTGDLIEISPVKKQQSANTNMLLDLNMDNDRGSPSKPRLQYRETFTYTPGEKKKKEDCFPIFNLMD
jgi:helicase required for RNAi-mediated heterochromatin assembly 1